MALEWHERHQVLFPRIQGVIVYDLYKNSSCHDCQWLFSVLLYIYWFCFILFVWPFCRWVCGVRWFLVVFLASQQICAGGASSFCEVIVLGIHIMMWMVD